jgi:predicted transcriptional regulator
MPSTKELVLEVLQKLPDDCSLEDVQYELYVRQRIVQGEKAADEGKLVPHEDVMREAREWLRRL